MVYKYKIFTSTEKSCIDSKTYLGCWATGANICVTNLGQVVSSNV